MTQRHMSQMKDSTRSRRSPGASVYCGSHERKVQERSYSVPERRSHVLLANATNLRMISVVFRGMNEVADERACHGERFKSTQSDSNHLVAIRLGELHIRRVFLLLATVPASKGQDCLCQPFLGSTCTWGSRRKTFAEQSFSERDSLVQTKLKTDLRRRHVVKCPKSENSPVNISNRTKRYPQNASPSPLRSRREKTDEASSSRHVNELSSFWYCRIIATLSGTRLGPTITSPLNVTYNFQR